MHLLCVFNRSLTRPVELNTQIKIAIQEIDFNLETNLLQIKNALLTTSFISGILVKGLSVPEAN